MTKLDSLVRDLWIRIGSVVIIDIHLASFGIGTSLSNDFKSISSGRKQKNKALNIVIKLYQVDRKFCAKISDELTKVWIWLPSSSYVVIPEIP